MRGAQELFCKKRPAQPLINLKQMATVNLMRNYCIPMHLDTKAKQLRKSLLALTNVFSPTNHSWWWLQTFSSCIYKTFYNECKTRSINGQLQPLWNLISCRTFYLVANLMSHYIEEEEEEEEIISKNQRYWNCRQISFLQQIKCTKTGSELSYI